MWPGHRVPGMVPVIPGRGWFVREPQREGPDRHPARFRRDTNLKPGHGLCTQRPAEAGGRGGTTAGGEELGQEPWRDPHAGREGRPSPWNRNLHRRCPERGRPLQSWESGSGDSAELKRGLLPFQQNLKGRHASPRGHSGKGSTCQCRRLKTRGFNPWVGKIPWRRTWQPTPVFFLENPMDRGAWRAIVHGEAESQR